MAAPRILSLLPSATDVVSALGLADALVGVTHECDAPQGVPRVTRGAVDPEAAAGEIDAVVRAKGDAHEPLDRLDAEAVRAARPDVVLMQTLCDVCAVSGAAIPTIRAAAPGARILDLSPRTLGEVAATFAAVGEETGVAEAGHALARAFLDRIDEVRWRAAERPPVPTLLLEWTDPPYAPGHWVPEIVEAAGGTCLAGEAGARSRRASWDDLLPLPAGAVVSVAACGMTVDRAWREVGRRPLPLPPGVPIWILDGQHHFARPGPRLVEGVEALAAVLHPDLFGPPPESAARRFA